MLHVLPKAADGCPLPPQLLSPRPSLRQTATTLRMSPRSTVYLEGFARAPQYRVIEGCIAISQALPDGRRQIIDMVGPGRLLGLGLGEHNRCTAETLSYVTLEPVGKAEPADLQDALHEMVLRGQALATLLGRKSAAERVAYAILDLAGQFARPGKGGKRGAVCFTLHPTRADLADWLGLTVETVSRCFTRLKRAGLIDFRHPEIVTLLKPETMAAIAAGTGTLASA